MNRQSNFKHSSFVTHAAPAVYNILSFSSRKSRNVARKFQFCQFRCAEHFRCCRQLHDDFYELRPPVSSINLHCFCNASVLLPHTDPSLLPHVYSAVFLLSIHIEYKIIIIIICHRSATIWTTKAREHFHKVLSQRNVQYKKSYNQCTATIPLI